MQCRRKSVLLGVIQADLTGYFLAGGRRRGAVGHGAANQSVKFAVRLLHLGLFFRRGLQVQFKVFLRFRRGGRRRSRLFLAAAELFKRVKAKSATRADLDALKRIVLHRVFQRFGRCIRPEVHIEFSAMGRSRAHGLGCGRRGRLRRCGRAAPRLFLLLQIRPDIKGRVLGRARLARQGAGQVFNRFLFRLLAEELGIVGCALGAFRFFFRLVAAHHVVDKGHHIGRGQRKENHEPHQEEQQHQDVGPRPPKQHKQHRADAAEDAARPKAGLPPVEKHLHNIPCGRLMDRKLGKDNRHSRRRQRKQQHFCHKQPDPVTRSHQVGQI